MRSIARWLAVIALIGLFFLTWRAQIDRDVVVAQTRKPIMATRIFTGPDGLSHAEEIELKMVRGGATDMMKAAGVEFSSRPASTAVGDWHTGPRRQFVITLSGRAEIEVAGGKKVAVGAGHINLIEDTTGKGHITRNFEDRIVVTIPLADGAVVSTGR